MKTSLPFIKNSTLLRILLLLALLLFITKIVSAQQVKEEWVRYYDGAIAAPVNFASANMVIDEAGNTFVARVVDNRTENVRVEVSKFSVTGEQLWLASATSGAFYEAIDLSEITLDANGDVYLIGSIDPVSDSRGDVFVAKVAGATGERRWLNTLSPYIGERGLHVAVDNNGGVYTVGRSSVIRIHFLSRFDAVTGAHLWTKDINWPSEGSTTPLLVTVFDLKADNAGNAYLTGTITQSGGETDIVTFKYYAAGEQVWRSIHATPLSETINGFAIDADGVYIAATNPDGDFIVAYDTDNGAELWNITPQYNGSNLTNISHFISDDAGGLLLTGSSGGQAYIFRYTTAGELSWALPADGPVIRLRVNSTGSLYVLVSSTDHAVLKIDLQTGQELWATGGLLDLLTLQELPNGTLVVAGRNNITHLRASDGVVLQTYMRLSSTPVADTAVGLTTDAENNVFVAGVSADGSGPREGDGFLVKYTPDGSELWRVQARDIRFTHLVTDAAGDAYVLGIRVGSDGRDDLYVTKYSGTEGDVLWQYVISTGYNRGSGIKVDDQGGVFVSGSEVHPAIPGGTRYYLHKIDVSTGGQLWVEAFSTLTSPATAELSRFAEFEVDAAGDVYVTGDAGNIAASRNIAVLKLSGQTGDRIWTKHYDSGNPDNTAALEVNDAGEVFVIGNSNLDLANPSAFIVKYDAATGEQLNVQQLEIDGQLLISAWDLRLDAAGGANMRGLIPTGDIILKYSTADLSLTWHTTIAYTPAEVEVDNLGNVYTNHIVNGDIITSKYAAADGAKLWEVTTDADTDLNRSLLALDNFANVLVAGEIMRQTQDVVIAKYSQGQDECNVPVQVTLSLPPQGIKVGEQVRTTADFGEFVLVEDTGIRWTWGDGSEPSVSYTAFGTARITGEHRYSQAGIYRVGLNFDESCLRPLNNDYEEWIAIYDPAAGFVTGGGWFDSPAGTYELMRQEERVEFSFNIRYRNNSSDTPQGNLVLHLGRQQLFRANQFDWLVISGDRAVFKGEGTVQGRGRYGFLVSVQDAGGNGANDRDDKIRVRIWNLEDGNNLVYDNFEQAGDIYDMNTALQQIERGQIIIHRNNQLAKATTKANKLIVELYNYPNTFTDRTTITFSTRQTENYVLEVYDMRGKLVKRLGAGTAQAGQEYKYELNGTDLPKGLYVARLVSDSGIQTIKMLLER